MKIKRTTILLTAVLGSAVGLSTVATLHAFNHGLGGAAESKGSVPADNKVPASIDGSQLVELTVALQNYQHHPGQEDSTDPRPEFQEIKSLTADEIRAYQEGTGYGMAKVAEGNHYPGPRHVLDLGEQLHLTEDQTRQIRQIEDLMHVAAVSAGKQLIADERKLNVLFADKRIDQTQLASLVAEIASLQGRLRLIHLDAHLRTQKILSAAQVDKYDELRGYRNPKSTGAGSEK